MSKSSPKKCSKKTYVNLGENHKTFLLVGPCKAFVGLPWKIKDKVCLKSSKTKRTVYVVETHFK